jgi:hypothetical protein
VIAYLLFVASSFASITFTPAHNYATSQEALKIQAASAKLKATIESECFGSFILSRPLIQTNGRTPTQVLEHIRSLAGTSEVRMYTRWHTSAIAYRNPPSKVINLNRKAFTLKKPDCEWAATEGHEAVGHAWGEYGHDYRWNKNRDFSVPYSIGAGVLKCCK